MSFLTQRFTPNLLDVLATGVLPVSTTALVAETMSDHRVSSRRSVLDVLPREAIGAELGVFTGLFSAMLLRTLQPRRAYFVDPWWKAFGEFYPDWGHYTHHGKLETKTAHKMAQARISRHAGRTDARVVVAKSEAFLSTLPDDELDWVYLDSTHSYEGTRDELEILCRKVKRGGIIAGDDWQLDEGHVHAGVRKAVLEAVDAGVLALMGPFPALQWAACRL